MNYEILRFRAVFLFLAVTFFSAGHAFSSDVALSLVVDGKPTSLIVIPDTATPAAKFGAKALRDHIFEMSGAKCAIVMKKALGKVTVEQQIVTSSKYKKIKTFILVGEGKVASELGLSATGLGAGGIIIKTFPNSIVLFGSDRKTPNDQWGTSYAATLFLEDYLGIRYLWPGQLGKIVPEKSTITINRKIDIRFTPKLKQRYLRRISCTPRVLVGLNRLGFTKEEYQQKGREAVKTDSEDLGWLRWHRMGGTLRLKSGHSFNDYWRKYGKEHPEWFALQPSGSRDQRSGVRCRLCVSNPELIKQIIRNKIKELDENPTQTSVGIGPNDGGSLTFCMCDRCKALDAPNGREITLLDRRPGKPDNRFKFVSLTDRMVYFWNAIAKGVTKKHPNALLVADAYSVYSAPPVAIDAHPNIVIRYVPITYVDEELRQEGLRDWKEWRKHVDKIYFRPNFPVAGSRTQQAKVYVTKMVKDFKMLVDGGMIGTDCDSCVNDWATSGINYYVLAKIHWNPDLKASDLIDDYCRSGFGPAAVPVKNYFRILEAITDRAALEPKTKPFKAMTVFTTSEIDKLRTCLNEAMILAKNDNIVKKRIKFLMVGLEWTAIYARVFEYLAKRTNGERLNIKETKPFLVKTFAMARNIFQNDFYAVNVAYPMWGTGNYWGRLGWDWKKDGAARYKTISKEPANKQ